MTESPPQAIPASSPATLVIFGATGDLAKRLLIPSIVNLARAGLISDDFTIIGIGSQVGDDGWLRDRLSDFVGTEGADDGETWRRVRECIRYLPGDFGSAGLFEALVERVRGPAAFYLATPPDQFGPIVDRLADAGLLDEAGGFRRVVIEKPFGADLPSAQALNRRILARIPESQIYRIDHFLGKETVRNILVSRFANVLLEAVWNNRYIDHIQITAAETVPVGTRGRFYDATGALRDMIPNHLFQLLAMIGMEAPNAFDADSIRNEKARLLQAVRGPSPDNVERDAVRGRYRGATGSPDYLGEANVAADSRTETYAAIKLHIDTWRWAGVPFYLRTGKALSARDTEIVIVFKPVPFACFQTTNLAGLSPNRLVLRIQPREGMSMDLVFKRPGAAVELVESSMDFSYAERFPIGAQTGYETLIHDVLMGDQTLFQRADMIEAGWAAVQPVLEAWTLAGAPQDYEPGSAGPSAANMLLERDDRQWHAIG